MGYNQPWKKSLGLRFCPQSGPPWGSTSPALLQGVYAKYQERWECHMKVVQCDDYPFTNHFRCEYPDARVLIQSSSGEFALRHGRGGRGWGPHWTMFGVSEVIGDPRVTMGFGTTSWFNDRMIWGYPPWLGKHIPVGRLRKGPRRAPLSSIACLKAKAAAGREERA